MADLQRDRSQLAAVDDVRRVREKIARRHAGNLRGHMAQTNRSTAKLRATLNIREVSSPSASATRARKGA